MIVAQDRKVRTIQVITEDVSWGYVWAEKLVEKIALSGDVAILCRDYLDIEEGDVAFFLNCTKKASNKILALNKYNLVVHASDLPKGRGFSPLSWLVLDGADEIPVCLLYADSEVDAGAVVFKDFIKLRGDELIDDMRMLLGEKTVELCLRFLSCEEPPKGTKQVGVATWYRRRTPADSELNPALTIVELFNQLRIADNERYPAFFWHQGQKFFLKIEKEKNE